MKKITIHSDGYGGVIVDEDGTKIEGVYAATVRVQAGDITRIDLEVISTGVKVEGTVDEVELVCPICQHSDHHKCDGGTLGGVPV